MDMLKSILIQKKGVLSCRAHRAGSSGSLPGAIYSVRRLAYMLTRSDT